MVISKEGAAFGVRRQSVASTPVVWCGGGFAQKVQAVSESRWLQAPTARNVTAWANGPGFFTFRAVGAKSGRKRLFVQSREAVSNLERRRFRRSMITLGDN